MTQVVIKIITNNITASIPQAGVGLLVITIRGESRLETGRRYASRIDKYLDYDSSMQTVNKGASRIQKYIDEDSQMQTTVNLASKI